MANLNQISIQILQDAKQEMHEKYVETNESIYGVMKMLIDFEIERQNQLMQTNFQVQPVYRACKSNNCTRQAPLVGDYCDKCKRIQKEKRAFKRNWSL